MSMPTPVFKSVADRFPGAPAGKVWEAFLFDSREILHVAQLIEGDVVCFEAVDYVVHTTDFAEAELIRDAKRETMADVRRKHLPAMLRVLFTKYGNENNMTLSGAIERWLPKLIDLYGEEPCKPVTELLNDVEWEWQWDDEIIGSCR